MSEIKHSDCTYVASHMIRLLQLRYATLCFDIDSCGQCYTTFFGGNLDSLDFP